MSHSPSTDPAARLRRGEAFRDLHDGPGPFVVPNPWDAGSARILASFGFAALATTGAGLAHSLGRPDGAGRLTREELLANAAAIVDATGLPVTADLESGFGERPEDVAETIRLAAAAGLSGGSVEDATGRDEDPLRPLDEAVERVAAAVEAAKGLDFPFTVTARAENFFLGRPDLDDTIRRLRAYEAAGADVLYAPALPDAESVRAVCAAVSRPVNVLMTGALELSVAELGALGVRRVSTGSALSRAALGALTRAAREITGSGTFGFGADALPYAEANALLAAPAATTPPGSAATVSAAPAPNAPSAADRESDPAP
ncbi:isocitrate lyase/phosphoenolpyruvate mutase family protein [Streptomyces sp. NPDC093801]|uniref:isocitrate lyase/PEP mutase family protein n=1 Tax=Streptomyces sp. NPDC093801 TaxID=3155203 RepID=UPI00344E0821